MKNLKIVLFSLFVMGTVFTSCSGDDSTVVVNDNEVEQEVVLEGKWFFTKDGFLVNGQEELADYEHSVGCAKDFIEISIGGIYRDVDHQGENCAEEIDLGKWERKDNILTLTYVNGEGETQEVEVIEATILSLTNTELKLKTIYEEGGVDVTSVTVFTRAN